MFLQDNERPQFVTPSYNFSSAAGIKYTVDVTKPAGSRVTILSMEDGKPFDLKLKALENL